MDIGDAIFSLLAADTGVIASVGKFNGKPNVFPDTTPRGVGLDPYIVLKLISDIEESSLTGDSGLGHSRITVECVASSHPAARIIRDAVVAVLQTYRGTPAGTGLFIQSCLIDSQRRFTTTVTDDDALSSSIRTVDFIVWHSGPA